MKLQIISDLHFEWLSPKEIYIEIKKIAAHQSDNDKADVLIIAGDLCSYRNIWWILNEFSKYYEHVVYVNGNHELYGTHIDVVREQRNRKDDHKINDNVHWLDNTKVVLNGFEFIGCTLWFPDLPGNRELSRRWSDFKAILNFRDYVYKENTISQEFLKQNMNENSIVVTHYLPSWKSVHKKYEGDPYNVFFVCGMEELIKEKNPSIVFHGHTHEHFEYLINKTQIISNPKGYPNEATEKPFDYFKTVEIFKEENTNKEDDKSYKFNIPGLDRFED